MESIVEMINQYGVPSVVAVGMGYFIFYIWRYVTQMILPTLSAAQGTLIGLIDRIRMLDNDMIRLDQKVNTILDMRESADHIVSIIEKYKREDADDVDEDMKEDAKRTLADRVEQVTKDVQE